MAKLNTNLEKKQQPSIPLDSYKRLFDSLPDFISIHDLKGNYIYVSPSVKKILGFSREDMIGKNAYEFFYKYDLSDIEANHKRLLKSKTEQSVEYRMITKSGGFVWIESKVVIEKDGEGKDRIVSVSRNINTRKEEERKFQLFAKYTPAAVAMLDRDLKYVVASDKWYIDYNIEGKDIIGKSHYEVFKNIPERWKKIHREALKGKEQSNDNDSFLDNDGNTQWLKWLIKPWKNYRDEVDGIIMFTEVITEEKLSQDKIKKQNEELQKVKKATINILEDLKEEKDKLIQFREAVENASDQIIFTDIEGKILYANEQLTENTGYTSEEVIGKTPSLWGGQMDKSFYQNLWKTIKTDKKPFTGELKNKRKNGEEYFVEIKIFPILDSEKDVKFFVGIERDISKQKEIDKMKSEFISVASHQLRTPLTAIRWYIEMLNDEKGLSEEVREYVNQMSESSTKMIQLVDDLLNVSRIERGQKFDIIKTQTTLKAVMEESISENKISAQTRKVKINSKITDSKLMGDKEKLVQGIKNLINNAIKYSPENGTVDVLAKPDGENVYIEIADHGIGIPKSEQVKVFSKFFRATNATKSQVEGNGLGLYIVKSIVEGHGGNIDFESEINKGTKFKITIPQK